MKIRERKNMKVEFERPRDFDFTVNRVFARVIDGKRQTVLVPAGSFSLFGIFLLEARAICNKISCTAHYICTSHLIDYETNF